MNFINVPNEVMKLYNMKLKISILFINDCIKLVGDIGIAKKDHADVSRYCLYLRYCQHLYHV